jgi:FixJ family two-component response regulator
MVSSKIQGDYAMPDLTPTVYVVDDDPEVLTATGRLLASADHTVVAYQSPQHFLQHLDRGVPGCLVVDLAMPGLTGLDLQRVLAEQGSPLRLVFLTGRGDIGSGVQAMKRGAVDFLTKPVNDADLLDAVNDALEQSVALQRARREHTQVSGCLAALTSRERQVLEHIVAGRLNKQIAADLGTVEKTIKFHRGNLMRKMGARSVADLVRLAERAGVGRAAVPH